jgi:hypothetical protein
VAQRNRSPNDDGDIDWDDADVEAINVEGGDVDCRAEEEGQGGEGNLYRGQRRFSNPEQSGLVAQERAPWGVHDPLPTGIGRWFGPPPSRPL